LGESRYGGKGQTHRAGTTRRATVGPDTARQAPGQGYRCAMPGWGHQGAKPTLPHAKRANAGRGERLKAGDLEDYL
jgi:hypothetical protein